MARLVSNGQGAGKERGRGAVKSAVRLLWPGRGESRRTGETAFQETGRQAGPAGLPEVPKGLLVAGDARDAVALCAVRGLQVDLAYLDPPFLTGRRQEGRRGSYADTWDGPGPYLDLMAGFLAGLSRILSPRGQVFVHVDWRVSHWIRCLLDEIFDPEAFRNEIVWHYESGGRAGRYYKRKWDAILWYAPGRDYVFHPERTALARDRCPKCGGPVSEPNHMKRGRDADGRPFRAIRVRGKVYRYYDDESRPRSDVWLDVSHLQQKDPERTGYPTQKPLALLERILLAHSEPGHLVADFFCGSGTTLVAAHRLGRNWVGSDLEHEAVEQARRRLAAEVAGRGGSFVVGKLVREEATDAGR